LKNENADGSLSKSLHPHEGQRKVIAGVPSTNVAGKGFVAETDYQVRGRVRHNAEPAVDAFRFMIFVFCRERRSFSSLAAKPHAQFFLFRHALLRPRDFDR
jgi:hypothetical protein